MTTVNHPFGWCCPGYVARLPPCDITNLLTFVLGIKMSCWLMCRAGHDSCHQCRALSRPLARSGRGTCHQLAKIAVTCRELRGRLPPTSSRLHVRRARVAGWSGVLASRSSAALLSLSPPCDH